MTYGPSVDQVWIPDKGHTWDRKSLRYVGQAKADFVGRSWAREKLLCGPELGQRTIAMWDGTKTQP